MCTGAAYERNTELISSELWTSAVGIEDLGEQIKLRLTHSGSSKTIRSTCTVHTSKVRVRVQVLVRTRREVR